MPTLCEIRTYPVKGLRGLSVRQARVEAWGLAGDRRWMLVDRQGGFISQRQLPRLAIIDAVPVAGGLRLLADGVAPLDLPEPDGSSPRIEVTIWKDRVLAREGTQAAHAWLSHVLAAHCRLVHMTEPAAARPADPEYARADDRVSFADAFPLLLTSAASLADLNARLAGPYPWNASAPIWQSPGPHPGPRTAGTGFASARPNSRR